MKGYDLPAADDATTGGAVQAAHAHTGQVEHASLVFNLQCRRARERALNRAQTEYRGGDRARQSAAQGASRQLRIIHCHNNEK